MTRVSISRHIEFQTYDPLIQPEPQPVTLQLGHGAAKIRGASGHADHVTVQTNVVQGSNPRVSCDISYWFNVASPPFIWVDMGVAVDGVAEISAKGETLVDDITIGVQNLGYGFVYCDCDGTAFSFGPTPISQGQSYIEQYHASDMYGIPADEMAVKNIDMTFGFITELSSS